ncbi:DUF6207 family protein [Streptomyces variegatus]|uniref:DUF6207 family protein n=1 Tax=Streptomyces variegatus TaxID=284040 RepID=UPI0030842DF4
MGNALHRLNDHVQDPLPERCRCDQYAENQHDNNSQLLVEPALARRAQHGADQRLHLAEPGLVVLDVAAADDPHRLRLSEGQAVKVNDDVRGPGVW